MFGLHDEKEPVITGFREPVEANGIKLSDDFFVHIDLDKLDSISKIQKETDPDTYKAMWEKKIGEKLFLYNIRIFDNQRLESVNLDYISNYIGDKRVLDMRLADKETLTRMAARKVANIFYYGEGDLNNPSVDATIAMILYIRNGYNKKDFWNNFKKELVLGLKELLENNDSLQIKDQLLANPIHEKDTTIMNLMKNIKEHAKYYTDDSFIIFDYEMADFIDPERKKYSDKEINQALGQYVLIVGDFIVRGLPKEKIFKYTSPKFLYMQSLDTCTYNAASNLKDVLFNDKCIESKINNDISEGLAVYRKNGKSETDFWKNTCRQIIYLYEKGWL